MTTEVLLNGEVVGVDDGTTVAALVEAHAASTRGIAVACNDEVVPRSVWASTPVQTGDRVEILTAAQGG